LLYFLKFGAQLQHRLLATTRRPHIHAKGFQQWAKGEVVVLAPHLPLEVVHVPNLYGIVVVSFGPIV
jgi:hypothetical protein